MIFTTERKAEMFAAMKARMMAGKPRQRGWRNRPLTCACGSCEVCAHRKNSRRRRLIAEMSAPRTWADEAQIAFGVELASALKYFQHGVTE